MIYGGTQRSKNKLLEEPIVLDKNVVEVWRMIAEGTIEERMDSLQQEKTRIIPKSNPGNEEQLTKLTEDDIRLILSHW